jgi:hypothetical protein
MMQSEWAPRSALAESASLPIDPALAAREPNDLDAIRALRRPGPRRLWASLRKDVYSERLEGAFIGRMAGCTLGAPVEFWYARFGDTIHSFLIGLERFSIRDVLQRFEKHAQSMYTQASAALLDSAQG